ncbi:HlyC/CorC family transporter [Natronosporangium hydrolyticum]|uniref:HlyC/CorC family transporter n=1 Tax=Natronosporangium hydrolyticum TaxID=2811111 RepID=A0A895YPY6_9ACTN|nr:HlyC/CorC family transporter [Natronosporangium hydrolyticum]
MLSLNAVFAGSEIALISLREGQLRRLERASTSGEVLAKLARDPNRFLATIQIGITLAGFLASATAAVTLAQLILPAYEPLGPAAQPAAVLTITLMLTFLMLVFGELTPKRIAMQHAVRWSLVVARPLYVVSTIATPAVWLLGRATNAAVRLFGGDPSKHRDEMTPAEIRDLVSAHRGFTAEQRLIIAGAIEITERRLRQVLVPRRSVFTLDADTSIKQACGQLAGSGHSRAPVVRNGNLDETLGVVNLRDLVTSDRRQLTDLLRPVVPLPDSLHAAEALRRFKADRQQFALVVDEHGAVAGIVTLEDLVEEVIGEIYDETDRDVQAARRDEDGALLLPGTFPVHDLPDVGVELEHRPKGDYTTVAGMVITALGHLPSQAGERVSIDRWTAEIVAIDRHAITQVRLSSGKRAGPGRPPTPR